MLNIVCGMPQEVEKAKWCFPDVPVIQFRHSSDFKLDDYVAPNCTRLLSFGLCGGLYYPLPVGGIGIANSLVDASLTSYQVDQELVAQLLDRARAQRTNVIPCPWYSSGLLDTADTRLQRRELHNKTGAWAIDDESLFVASYAKEHNLSFAILRSVSDDVSETLPLAARFGIIKPDGTIDVDYLLRAIAKEPLCQTLDLFKLAADFTYSLQTLEYVGHVLKDVLEAGGVA